MTKYKTVEEFLKDLSSEHREQVELLRTCILETEPSLVENIKWNAPNFVYKDVDRITFSLLNRQNQVKIILHKGVKEKEDKKAEPILQDDTGLIQWNSNIRGTLAFDSTEQIKSNYQTLQALFKKWLAL